MKILIFVSFIFALSSCASVSPQKFNGPNGKNAYSMRCSGMGRTWDKCYQKAGELCQNGYNIIQQSSSTVAVPYGNSIIAAPRQTLAIECK
jgi:hypothetical protein